MSESPKPLKFDLVSDLHVEYWEKPLDWNAVRNNDIVIVAGDVADTLEETRKELERISKAYKTVLYIDGNHEFCEKLYHGGEDTADFDERVRAMMADFPNVHFLKDGPVIIDGTAIIGRNGHWDYEALDGVSHDEARDAVISKLGITREAAEVFEKQAKQDTEDLKDLVRQLGQDKDIHSILVVTHTMPTKQLIPKNLPSTPAFFSNLANAGMADVLKEDVNGKITTWVFGHWHRAKDETLGDVRYVSHPRGTPARHKPEYKPLSIEVAPRPEQHIPPAPQAQFRDRPRP
jgi:predicted phosphohydrolase